MALIILASAAASPGVTTTALGLTLSWPADVLLADCDRTPNHTVLAGQLRGTDAGGRGLTALAAAHRSGVDLSEELPNQWLSLMPSESPDRRFLPGFTHPGSPRLFAGVWSDFAVALSELSRQGRTVIVDLGRIGESVPAPLLNLADRLLLVTGSTLRHLGALQLHADSLKAQVAAASGHCALQLVIVGAGRPYSSNEISKAFGLPVEISLPYVSTDATALLDGEPMPHRGNGRLLRAYQSWALGMHAQDLEHRKQIGVLNAAPDQTGDRDE
jgi:hypothetical protein